MRNLDPIELMTDQIENSRHLRIQMAIGSAGYIHNDVCITDVLTEIVFSIA